MFLKTPSTKPHGHTASPQAFPELNALIDMKRSISLAARCIRRALGESLK
jgi:hypothetical protein